MSSKKMSLQDTSRKRPIKLANMTLYFGNIIKNLLRHSKASYKLIVTLFDMTL